MAVGDRPYAGSWVPPRESVDHAPDAIVMFNGSPVVTACARCGIRVDVNRYVIEVSVEAGTEPGGASASLTLSLPPDLASKDGRTLIPNGAEVEIYMRGYFPARGLFADLRQGSAEPGAGSAAAVPQQPAPAGSPASTGEPAAPGQVSQQGSHPEDSVVVRDKGDTFKGFARRNAPNQIVLHESATESSAETVSVLQKRGLSVHYTVDVDGGVDKLLDDSRRGSQLKGNNARSIGIEISNPLYGRDALEGQTVIKAGWAHTGRYAVPPQDQVEASYGLVRKIAANNQIPVSFPAEQGDTFQLTQLPRDRASQPGVISHENWGDHADGAFPSLYMAIRERGYPPDQAYATAVDLAQKGNKVQLPPKLEAAAPPEPAPAQAQAAPAGVEAPEFAARDSEPGEEAVAYPYYHVFRGVVVDGNQSQQEGSATESVQCQSLLHFWQYEVISANASLVAARPSGSGLKVSYLGHNLVGRHPYQIIYELHQDILGAAAGVDWVLKQKTNRDASSEAGQFFSLTRQYWAQRFSRRSVKLRMHGLTGNLYSAMQSAFLARTPTDKLRDVLRERDASVRLRRQRGSGLMDQAATLGLLTTPAFSADKGESPVELNLAEMTAFVSDIGAWGQLNIFESAYESKLDIVHKVCEVTGFEFYQDVDGDFVFKPPLYNLDTSGCRAYCLEPEDLLSFAIQEHEPQVTYATVRGSHFKNLQGHGVEGKWGIQGQYVDFRLVAQYGWRPEDVETAYLTDPRSAFYLAANRVDLSSAQASAASATVPLRPEVRPGYPFYVRELDCYYYCRGLSHSWVLGGQCSTNLTLVARREAFHAPGHPGGAVRGLAALDLGDGTLPPRPLIAATADGDIRVAGFPNVVMALDPDHVDPAVLRLGSGLDRIDDPLILRSMLETAVQRRVAQKVDDGSYAVDLPDGSGGSRRVLFSLSGGVPGAVDALGAARQVAAGRRATSAEREKLQQQLRAAEEVASAPAGPAGAPDRAAARKKASDLKTRLRELDSRPLGPGQGSDAALLFQAIQRVAEQDLVPTTPGDEKGSRALALLRVIGDQKGSFLSDKVPGYYRYYSASHPNPEQQGPPTTSVEVGPDGKISVSRSPAMLDPRWVGTQVAGFQPTRKGRADVDPVAVKPLRGIRVLTADASRPTGEVVPTSQVLEVSFGALDLWRGVPVRQSVPTFEGRRDEAAYEREALTRLSRDAAQAAAGRSARQVFQDSWASLQAESVYAWAAAKAAHGPSDLTFLQPPPFPAEVAGPGASVSSSAPVDWTPSSAERAAQGLSRAYAQLLAGSIDLWVVALEDQGSSAAAVLQLRSTLVAQLRSRFGVAGAVSSESAVSDTKRKPAFLEYPIFPVSDAKGYRVVGAFRYGRGLEVAAEGSWAALRRQDPLGLLDRSTVERVLDEVVGAGQLPAPDLAQEVARQLRQEYTDQQLLDLGLARRKPGSDLLEIGLLNWFADGREGIAKVPAANTATRLSALSLSEIGDAPAACACMTPDLDLPGLEAGADAQAISRALQERADKTVPSWRAAQDAVRGAKKPEKVPFGQGVQAAAQAVASLGNLVDQNTRGS